MLSFITTGYKGHTTEFITGCKINACVTAPLDSVTNTTSSSLCMFNLNNFIDKPQGCKPHSLYSSLWSSSARFARQSLSDLVDENVKTDIDVSISCEEAAR